ncbi:MAG: energy transducer TonB [Crocinitomicaceae bacterium]
MERKKSKEADLERKVWVFRSLGLILVAAVVLMAFTYKIADPEDKFIVDEDNSMDSELIFDIPMEEPEPPPEVEDTPPPIIEEIEKAEDDEEIEEFDLGLDEDIVAPPPIEEEEVKVEPIVDFAEVEPEFPGGEAAMMEWIRDHIEYPPLSIEMGEQGIVYVQFVVNKDGSIEQVRIMRGVSDPLDSEAKRVVKAMPKWKPGEQAGKKVRVRYTLPIHFRLG